MLKFGKLFGFRAALFILNNNKVKVPLVLAPTTLPAPVLMHLEYKVRLPDLNIVMGTPHKLILQYMGSVISTLMVRSPTWENSHSKGVNFIHICSHCMKWVQIRSHFWPEFPCIWIEYRKIRTRNNSVSKSPYSVRIQENLDQK